MLLPETLSGFSEPNGETFIAVVPEPASLALLGLGGVMMLGRRRQQT